MKFTENTTLEYNKNISEELFNLLIEDLKKQGFVNYNHCNFNKSTLYKDWKREGFFNICPKKLYITGKYFAIDNNDQYISYYIYLRDILYLLKEPDYEIY